MTYPQVNPTSEDKTQPWHGFAYEWDQPGNGQLHHYRRRVYRREGRRKISHDTETYDWALSNPVYSFTVSWICNSSCVHLSCYSEYTSWVVVIFPKNCSSHLWPISFPNYDAKHLVQATIYNRCANRDCVTLAYNVFRFLLSACLNESANAFAPFALNPQSLNFY
jgi:hypothetical protein